MSGMINALVRDARSIAVSGHVRPDGDCVGACLGLWNYLRKTMPQVRVDVYLGTYASSFSFLSGEDRILHEPSDEAYDLFISLDAAALDRLERFEPMFRKAARRIVIDHHETNPGYGEENLIEGGASASCCIPCWTKAGSTVTARAASISASCTTRASSNILRRRCGR